MSPFKVKGHTGGVLVIHMHIFYTDVCTWWFVRDLCFGILLCFIGSRPDLYVTLIWANSCWLCLVIDILCIVLYNSTFLSLWISGLWVAHSCCPWRGARQHVRRIPVQSVFVVLFSFVDLAFMIWTRCLLNFFFFPFPAIGSTRWRCELALQICHLWKPELSSNLDGPSLEGVEFCQLTLYLALAISIRFSLSKALRLIKRHKAASRKQSSAGHLARKISPT